MKQKVFLSIATLALGLGACTSDLDDVFSVNSGKDVVSVTIAPETRTEFSTNGTSIVWSTGDKIGIFCGTTDPIAEYTLSGTPSGNSATFTGISSGTKTAAVYPYNSGATFDGTNTITTTLASTFDYSASTINGAPMAALISADAQDAISFKNPGAIMEIKVTNIPDGYKAAKLSAGEQMIAGNAQIAFADGIPTLTIVEDAANNSSDITISFSSSKESEKVFYFPLPVADYTKLTFSLIKDDSELNVFSKALNAERNTKYFKYFTFDAVDAEIPSEAVSGTEAATETLKELSAVVVTVGEEETPKISLPTAASGAGPVSITFSAISTTKPITIKETDEEATAATEVNIASEEKTAANNNLVIELPNSTVNINKGEYTSIEASTAENTLILANGVTVSTLTVKKGNVRVKKGATITKLVNESSGKPVVLLEKDATPPTTYTDGDFEIVDAALYELQKVCEDGGECTLSEDVEGDLVVSASAVTINLGGNTITNKSGDTFTVNSGSTLTINGTGTVDNVTNQKACIYNNGTVILNGGTYTRSKETGSNTTTSGGNSFYNILNHGTMTIGAGVKVTSTGAFSSLIESGYYNYTSGSARTGYVDGTNQAAPSLTIDGGTFSGGINTIKNDDGATLTISGGEFGNTTQATVQNNNTATISGGTFNPTSSASHAVESKYYNGDKNAGVTTITGGTFNGELFASDNNQNTVAATYAKFVVSGGTFSDLAVFDYITADGNVNVTLDKDVEITKPAYLTVNATVSVDLNGKTVTNKTALDLGKSYKFTEVFKAKAGTLNISDSKGGGKVQALNDEDDLDGYRYAICAIEDATVNISGGSFYNHQNNNQQLDLVEVNNNAKVYITGGTFESGCYGTPNNAENGRYWVLNKNNAAKETCTISVSGGTFVNFNPANPNMDDDDSYLADGYSVKSYTNAECTEGETAATEAHKGTTSELKRWYKVSKTTAE